jgi:2-oxoglutarate ferredoxin oxidoreductase subunit gamma
VFNLCVLGTFIGLTRVVQAESIVKVLETRMPVDFLEMNKKALQIGLQLADALPK